MFVAFEKARGTGSSWEEWVKEEVLKNTRCPLSDLSGASETMRASSHSSFVSLFLDPRLKVVLFF